MTETAHYLSAPCALPHSSPALENAAVAHCCEVWERTRLQAREAGNSVVVSRVAGHKAFQKSLPPLTGRENIQNFIACVAHGMLIGAILSQDGTRLLYAAQVAMAADHSPATQPKTGGE
jgi:hypothetical protein